ncbi:MAG: PD40 domain-containing protein [Acidobacteria bacterium]|nr:PD40 domain-containing protein [Acidobacteriota bacterium]
MRAFVRLLVLGAVVSLAALPAAAQFGKNKITYKEFNWRIYRAPHFDVHHYLTDERQLAEIVSEAESAYLDISKRLDHEVRDRIPLLLYNTRADFLQTNVIMQVPEFAGAFAEPFQNRMVLPIDDPSDKRYKLIRHELVHIFEYDILYAGSLKRALRSNPPTWLMEGLASYLADDEDSFDQMVIRDAVVHNLVPSVRQLDVLSFLTYRYGHAIFAYIAKTWGPEGVRTFLFEYRKVLLNRAVDKVFEDAFGLKTEQFDRRFARFLRQRYLPILTGKRSPDEYGKEIGLPEPGRYTFSPELSPSGELIAALATPKLELDVVILSAKDGKVIRNLTRGFTNSYEDVVAEAFDRKRDLAWSPEGDRIAFFVEKENYRPLLIYNPTNGDQVAKYVFKEIAGCASPSFSPDGASIAFSGNLAGVWDVFRYDLRTNSLENVTQDEYYDSNPSWSPDGKKILYNRRIGQFEKVFTVEVGAPERKVQLTTGAASDVQPSYSRDAKTVYFSSDRGEYGVYNLHRLDLATGGIDRLTDLVGGAFSPAEMSPAEDGTPQLAYATFFGGTFRLFRMKTAGQEVDNAIRAGQSEPQTSPLAPSRQQSGEPELLAPQPDEDGSAEKSPPGTGSAPAAPEQQEQGDQPGQQERKEEPPPAGEAGTAPPVPPPGQEIHAVSDADDLRPFRPPLELRLDPEKNEKYRAKWDVDAPDITVGVTDDGTILSNVSVNFSDLLGDQRVFVRMYSISDFTNTNVTYLNLAGRLDWGAEVFDYRDYYLSGPDTLIGGNDRFERRQHYTSIAGFASYPFTRHTRVEGSLGYAKRSANIPFLNEDGFVEFAGFSESYPHASLDLVNDTARYQEFGPFQGRRLRIGVGGYRFTSGDFSGESVSNVHLDFQGYQRVTRRSQLAVRLRGLVQSGQQANVYGIGGINQIRGYRFREFVGDSYAIANFEYRLPLFDSWRFAFGMDLAPARAFIFADVGSAWFNDTEFCDVRSEEFNGKEGTIVDCSPAAIQRGKAWYDPRLNVLRKYEREDENGKLLSVQAAAGAGLQVWVLGLPFTWSFAKIYDGDNFGPWHSDFYIVFDW